LSEPVVEHKDTRKTWYWNKYIKPCHGLCIIATTAATATATAAATVAPYRSRNDERTAMAQATRGGKVSTTDSAVAPIRTFSRTTATDRRIFFALDDL